MCVCVCECVCVCVSECAHTLLCGDESGGPAPRLCTLYLCMYTCVCVCGMQCHFIPKL